MNKPLPKKAKTEMVDATKLLIGSILALFFLIPCGAIGGEKADKVLVIKSESKLYLLKENKIFATYHVAFGANPEGHKRRVGDERTPEGRYLLDFKKPDSDFYKSIHISYPNEADIKRARQSGVSPGCCIMIHGQKNGLGWLAWIAQRFDWTDGCIAVTNSAMDEIWEAVRVGTPIEIKP
jgi:murein L,D-transpeptidase YafK